MIHSVITQNFNELTLGLNEMYISRGVPPWLYDEAMMWGFLGKEGLMASVGEKG